MVLKVSRVVREKGQKAQADLEHRHSRAQSVNAGIWYIFQAQNGSHLDSLGPEDILYGYMNPSGRHLISADDDGNQKLGDCRPKTYHPPGYIRSSKKPVEATAKKNKLLLSNSHATEKKTPELRTKVRLGVNP